MILGNWKAMMSGTGKSLVDPQIIWIRKVLFRLGNGGASPLYIWALTPVIKAICYQHNFAPPPTHSTLKRSSAHHPQGCCKSQAASAGNHRRPPSIRSATARNEGPCSGSTGPEKGQNLSHNGEGWFPEASNLYGPLGVRRKTV